MTNQQFLVFRAGKGWFIGASEHSSRHIHYFHPATNVTCPHQLDPEGWTRIKNKTTPMPLIVECLK